MKPVKIIVLGPVGAGKTMISNFLADATEMSADYRPTQGVRILEFEIPNVNVKNTHTKVDVELWDCSGDRKFEDCWPGMRKDTQGVIFVYNKATDNQIRALEKFHDYFVNQANLEPKNCLVFFYETDQTAEVHKKMTNIFAKISQENCNVTEGGKKLKTNFQALVSALMTEIQEKIEQEENSILKGIVDYRK